jgi:uncharacterized OB-fold protein
MSDLIGKVCSHTVIRVPGNAHADAAPFVLLLVELDDNTRMLGHFAGSEPPLIGSRVVAEKSATTPVFRTVEEES